jgi:hypothetical protein
LEQLGTEDGWGTGPGSRPTILDRRFSNEFLTIRGQEVLGYSLP